MYRRVLAVFCLAGSSLAPASVTLAADPALPLIFSDNFANGAGRWEPTDPKAWKVVPGDKGKVYSLFQQSKYKPPYRSPFNFSRVKDVYVSDFIMEARVKSTTRDYPHRDMCLIFGYQDSAHFYYAHLAKKTDEHANQIFIVDGEPRKKISSRTSPGTDWDGKWHTVKVVRTVADGGIEVYFDDLKTPVMTATDKHFTWGQVGLGSFDDTGDWADVKLWGIRVDKKDRARK
jgi:hypothetical protein